MQQVISNLPSSQKFRSFPADPVVEKLQVLISQIGAQLLSTAACDADHLYPILYNLPHLLNPQEFGTCISQIAQESLSYRSIEKNLSELKIQDTFKHLSEKQIHLKVLEALARSHDPLLQKLAVQRWLEEVWEDYAPTSLAKTHCRVLRISPPLVECGLLLLPELITHHLAEACLLLSYLVDTESISLKKSTRFFSTIVEKVQTESPHIDLNLLFQEIPELSELAAKNLSPDLKYEHLFKGFILLGDCFKKPTQESQALLVAKVRASEEEKEKERDFTSLVGEIMDTFPNDEAPQVILDYLEKQLIPLLEKNQNQALELLIFLAGKRDFPTKKVIAYFKSLNLGAFNQDPRLALLIKRLSGKPPPDFSNEEMRELISLIEVLIKMGEAEALQLIHLIKISAPKTTFLLQLAQSEADPARSRILMEALSPLMRINISLLKEAYEIAKTGKPSFRNSINQFILEFPLPFEKEQSSELRSLWLSSVKDPNSCVNCYEACQNQTIKLLGILFKGAKEAIEFYEQFMSKAIAQRPIGGSFIPLFEARSTLKENLELNLHRLKKVDLPLIKACTKFPSKNALARAWSALKDHLNDVINSVCEMKNLEFEAKKFIAFCLTNPHGFRTDLEQDVAKFISTFPVNGDLDSFKRIEVVLSFLIKNQLASKEIGTAFYEFLIKAFREIHKSPDKADLYTCPIYLFLRYSQFFEKGLEKEHECFEFAVLACLKWLQHFPGKEVNCQGLIQSLWAHARSRSSHQKSHAGPSSAYSPRRQAREAKHPETDSTKSLENALIQTIIRSVHQGNPKKDFLYNLIYPLLMTFINSTEFDETKLKVIEYFIYSYPFNPYEGKILSPDIGQMMSCLVSEAIGQQVFKVRLYEMLELLMYLPQEYVKDIVPARGTNFNRIIALSVLVARLSQANTQFGHLHCMTLLKQHQAIFQDCWLILLKNYHTVLNQLTQFHQNIDTLSEEKKKDQRIFLRSILQICIDQIHDIIRDLKIEQIDKEQGKYFFEFLHLFSHLLSKFKKKGLYESNDQSFFFITNTLVSTLESLENLFKDHRSFAAHCIPVYEYILTTLIQFDPPPTDPKQYAKAIVDLTQRAAKHAPFFNETNAFSAVFKEKELIDFIFQGAEDLKEIAIANLEKIACPALRAPRSSPIDPSAADSLIRLISIPSKEELEKLNSLKKVAVSSEAPEKRLAALRSLLPYLNEIRRGVPDFYLELNAACKELKNEELHNELWAVIAQENMLQLAVNGTGGAVQIFIELLKRWSNPPDFENVSRFFLKKGYLNTVAQIFKDPIFKDQKREFYALLLNIALSFSKPDWSGEEGNRDKMKLAGPIVYECVRKLTEEKHSFDSSLKEIIPFCFRYFHHFFSAKVPNPQLSWPIFYLMNFAYTHDPASIESFSPEWMNKVVENIHNQIKKLLTTRFTNFTRQTIGSGFSLYTALQKKFGDHIDFRFLADMNDLTLRVLIKDREIKNNTTSKESDKSVKKESSLFITISRQVSSFVYPHLSGETITETVRQTLTRMIESYLITMRKHPETFTDLFQLFYILFSKLCEKKALLNEDEILCFTNLIKGLAKVDPLSKSQVELIKELIKKENEFFLRHPKLSWQLMMVLRPHTLQEGGYSTLKLCKLPGYFDSMMELLEEMCTLKSPKACERIGPLLTFVNFRMFKEDWEKLGSFYEKWIKYCQEESYEDKHTTLFKSLFTSLLSPVSDSKTPLIEFLEENHHAIIRKIIFKLIDAVADCYQTQNDDAQALIDDAMNFFTHTVKRKYVNKNSNLTEYFNLLLKIIKMFKTAEPTSSYHTFIGLGKLFSQLSRAKLNENERMIFAKAIVKYTDLFEDYNHFSDFHIPPFFDRENMMSKGIFKGLPEMEEKFESNLMQATGNTSGSK